jgi:ubiquinone biosynthesis protein
MLLKALVAARDLGRLNEIAGVLVRHGFGDLVHRTGVVAVLEATGRALRIDRIQGLPNLPPSERMRKVLEELGPTFVKLGQVLASRPDLLPPDWLAEFSKLHEDVPTVPFDTLRPQLERVLGQPPEEIFEELDTEPLAAGSIAQVHRATLAEHGDVVLKIRRPGIAGEVAADLRLLERFAEVLEQEVHELRRFHPRRIAKQFARTMRAELDLSLEARTLRQVSENLEEQSEVVIPQVIDPYADERLLVLTFVDGTSAAEWLRGERPDDIDPRALVHLGADVVLDMVFVHGLYHADPHPGNVLFLPDSRIGLLDFGMVGRLSEERRREFVELLGAVADHDEEAIVDVLLSWSDGGRTDVEFLTQDARAFLDRYHGVPLGSLDVTRMLRDIADIVRENQLTLPSDVAMLVKVFVTLEGLGRSLDPGFDMAAHVEPAARRMIARLHSPSAVAARGMRDVKKLLLGLPQDLRSILLRARRGGLRIELDLKRLEEFGHTLDHSANRITGGVVTAALIVGSAIALTVDQGPTIMGFPIFALLGFVSSFGLGMILVWSIIRSGRS